MTFYVSPSYTLSFIVSKNLEERKLLLRKLENENLKVTWTRRKQHHVDMWCKIEVTTHRFNGFLLKLSGVPLFISSNYQKLAGIHYHTVPCEFMVFWKPMHRIIRLRSTRWLALGQETHSRASIIEAINKLVHANQTSFHSSTLPSLYL